jgi:hypothetical protein
MISEKNTSWSQRAFSSTKTRLELYIMSRLIAMDRVPGCFRVCGQYWSASHRKSAQWQELCSGQTTILYRTGNTVQSMINTPWRDSTDSFDGPLSAAVHQSTHFQESLVFSQAVLQYYSSSCERGTRSDGENEKRHASSTAD